MTDIAIVGASRTPIGAFGGSLASVSASELGKTAIAAALKRASISPDWVGEVIFGQVLTAGLGQNPARQAAMRAQIPEHATALTINQVCGSGLRAVALGVNAIKDGTADVVVAGGQESMSLAPHAVAARKGLRLGNGELIDTLVKDGLWDAFNDIHMGITAENVAREWKISRKEQDEYAVQSQRKAAAAQAEGRFADEIAPVTIRTRKGEVVVSEDEFIRGDTTMESLSGLRPAFDKSGTVTAGNASGINDGAAAVVLMDAKAAREREIQPLACVRSWAQAGVDPRVMGTGPVPASRLALKRANWSIPDLDLIEANEAFAAQACAVNRDMNWPVERVNVHGGAIALGHPIGASGCRILVTLLHALQHRDLNKGLATLCIGGGMGISLCVERTADCV